MLTRETIMGVLDDPKRFMEAKQRAMEACIRVLAELTPAELLEKWERGEREHGTDLAAIDVEHELREEAMDLFWYCRIRDAQ